MKIEEFYLEEEPSFGVLGLFFITKSDWYSYIVVIDKTASKKFGALAREVSFSGGCSLSL